MKLIDKRFWILLIPIIIISCNGNSKEGGAESAESNLTVFGQIKDFEHHAFLIGDTLYCSAVEASGYNDFHGCKISDIYNIVDTCYIETGDERNTAAYHLAILSPDCLDGGWDSYGDRVLLIKKGNDTFIYDNVISNEIFDDAPCERFLIPSEDNNYGTFNRPCDFELEFIGGQGYRIMWNIGIRILDNKLYVAGLRIWESVSSLTYTKNITFEYEEKEFPLEMFERSMMDTVRNDKNPLYGLHD